MKYFFFFFSFLFFVNANALDRFCNGAPTTIQANGGGRVALTAIVEATVFVGPEAAVCEYAMVFGMAQVRDNSRVYGKAQVGDGTIVSGDAEVFGNAMLASNSPSSITKILDNSKIYGNASVIDGSTIKGSARVFENARISLNATIEGFAQVYGSATITDTALVKGSSRIHGNAFIGLNTVVSGDSNLCSLKKYPVDTVLSNAIYCLVSPKPIPSVVSVTPNNGPVSGGTTILIVGTNFTSGDSVFVGGASCSSVLVINPTTISCTTSTRMAGAANVVVTNVDSKSGMLLNGYTYNEAPSITSITPTGGILAGGTPVVIKGNNFIPGVAVNLGGATCSVASVNTTTINCTTTSHAAGVVAVNVMNPDGQFKALNRAYAYRGLPVVVNVLPKIGSLSGGSPITILGSNFTSGASVELDGVACLNVNVQSSTKISCTPAAHSAGAVNVRVTNVDSQTGVLVDGYIYQGAPTIASVTPNVGALAGGNTITINGANYFPGATVLVGSNACTSIIVLSSTAIQCKVPARAAGTVSILITNIDNQSVSLTNGYTYQTSPVIYNVSPSSGFSVGATDITITGNNFLAGATIDMGGSVCGNVTVQNSTTIKCKTSAHAAGTVNVKVTNSDSQAYTLLNGFYYTETPTVKVNSIYPSGGPIAGGTTINISGQYFLSGASVDIGGVACGNVNVVSSYNITCVTSSRAAGTVNVTVTNPNTQVGSLNNGYTYRAVPVVAGISPSSGTQFGGQAVTITGSHFTPGISVSLGGASCKNIIVIDSSTITCLTSSHAIGSVSVDVTDLDSQIGTLPNGYVYQQFPRVSSVVPANGAVAGGTSVTLNGENFLTGASVDFGGAACNVTALSSTMITCTTSAHSSGVVPVTILNPDGRASVVNDKFTYRDALTVAAIFPTNGSINGGTFVTISGTNFYTGIEVKVGTSPCYPVAVKSSTELTCSTSAHASAVVAVQVIAHGQTAGLGSAFTYRAPITLTAVSKVNAGPGHTCARLNNGDVRCWGRGSNGQLGDGNGAEVSPSPGSNINLGSSATQVVVSNSGTYVASTCAILSNGSLKCWGANDSGQLGYGDQLQRFTPGGVIDLGGSVSQVSLGASHACALLVSGSVRCWGNNFYGQLGYGDTSTIFSPGGILNFGESVTQISAGGYHTCALLASGSVRCWGYNNVGQLGYGDTDNRSLPGGNVALGGVATQIVTSNSHTCALLNTGAVRCWGDNGSGELGYGDNVIRLSPGGNINLGGVATQISIAYSSSCALLNTGSMRCWGNNNWGQLGYGDATSRPSPGGDVPLGVSATQISVGAGYACAVTNTGTIRCWGNNYHGQLGNGTRQDQYFPWDDVSSFAGNSVKKKSHKNYVEVFQNNKEKYWSDNE
ncbi:hypothetical protein C0V70_10115 [Bacteriovorax stolpii]|uniref:Uncharacterized protein n=1 Tax=Bacteriovorax stolpii TaxID=960 RepID=A0A2K9NSI2_BACTC|nr:IPT/TIG domain-containing protein [Bacteriovorax stolpii]AUN98452.1 hypothetical protein C0V70_10115 [Bacteriovorax stolpii]TDP50923.1 alpha-tubulin suppressor-like RCC1 family protein [Bacteriovorax stolpii]